MSNIHVNKKESAGKFYLYLVCVIAALGGFLFGFDTAVISGTVNFVEHDFSLNAVSEGWFVSCALLGCIVGVAFSGKLSDKYGRKIVLIISAILFLSSAIGCMLSEGFASLVAFRLIGGLGIGVASMVSPLYISEFSPAHFRGMMVSLYQLALTVGIVIAYFSNAWLVSNVSDHFSNGLIKQIFSDEVWRAMLGLGSIPAIIFLAFLFAVPESPRWLLLQGKTEEAMRIFSKVDGHENALAELKAFEHLEMHQGESSLKELLTPVFKRPLMIGVLLPFLSQVCGINAVIYYGPKILEQAGFTLNNALGGQVTIGLVNLVFTFVAIFTGDRWGRRPLLFVGIGGVVAALLIIGILFAFNITSGLWILIFILAFIACFSFSFGPVCWVVVSEIFPAAVRGKAMSIATLSLWIGNFFVGQLTPTLLEKFGPSGTFWLFALCCSPAIWITKNLIPETKGKSLEMIEEYWTSSYHDKRQNQIITKNEQV